MTTPAPTQSEAARLEALWGGDFGDEYVDRNAAAYGQRGRFWNELIDDTGITSALEIGCNIGGNLQWISERVPEGATYGIDINRKALAALHRRLPDVNALWGPARTLPFRDRMFDMVFTMGVLIHQPDATLPLVLSEMVRCSSRYVFCGEYFAAAAEEVPYHGHEGALFRRDYGGIIAELFPELTLHSQGHLGRDEGWDDITWWCFERC